MRLRAFEFLGFQDAGTPWFDGSAAMHELPVHEVVDT